VHASAGCIRTACALPKLTDGAHAPGPDQACGMPPGGRRRAAFGAIADELLSLGRWGAPRLGDPREGEIVTAESFAMALRTTFRPDTAGDVAATTPVTYEVHLGDLVTHAIVTGDRVTAGTGPATKADLIIRSGPEIKQVMAGEISPTQALRAGTVTIEGSRRLWTRFARTFRT